MATACRRTAARRIADGGAARLAAAGRGVRLLPGRAGDSPARRSDTPRRSPSCWASPGVPGYLAWTRPSACACSRTQLGRPEPARRSRAEALSPGRRARCSTRSTPMADVQRLNGPQAAQTCVISMSRAPATRWRCCCWRARPGSSSADEPAGRGAAVRDHRRAARRAAECSRSMLASPAVPRGGARARRPPAGDGRLLGQQQGRRLPGRDLGDVPGAAGTWPHACREAGVELSRVPRAGRSGWARRRTDGAGDHGAAARPRRRRRSRSPSRAR